MTDSAADLTARLAAIIQELTAPQIVEVKAARYVRVALAAEITGYSEKAIRRKMEEGVWREGGWGHLPEPSHQEAVARRAGPAGDVLATDAQAARDQAQTGLRHPPHVLHLVADGGCPAGVHRVTGRP